MGVFRSFCDQLSFMHKITVLYQNMFTMGDKVFLNLSCILIGD